MASLYRTPRGYRLEWRADGQRHTRLYATKSEALPAKRNIEAKLAAKHTARRGGALTLAQLIDQWLDSRPQTYRHHDEAAMRLLLARHPGWTAPGAITRDDLLALPIGHYRLLRAALRYGAAMGQEVPESLLQSQRRRSPATPAADLITDDQVAAAQASADRWGPCYGLAVHLVSRYGHRPASIVACTVASLSDQRLTLPIKGGDIHRHPVLPETATRWLAAGGSRPPDAPILIHSGGCPWKSSTSLTSWYYHHIGTVHHPDDPGIYALKRYAITRMLDRGIDARTIASITGHRTPSLILDRYSRTRDDRQRRAIDAISAPNPTRSHTTPS